MEYSPRFTFFTSLFYCVAVAVVVLLIWRTLLGDLVSVQREMNVQRHLLISGKKIDINQFEKRQQKMVKSETHLRFIAALHQQNQDAVLILQELNKSIPSSIELSQLIWQGRKVQLDGFTHSVNELDGWIHLIAKSEILTAPIIVSMNEKNNMKYFQVRMEVKG